VQGERVDLDTASAEALEQGVGEVQAGRGRCHRPIMPSVHGLIAFTIERGRVGMMRDVGRKRGQSIPDDELVDRPVLALHEPLPRLTQPGDDQTRDRRVTHLEASAYTTPSPGTDERAPPPASTVPVSRRHEHELHGRSPRIAGQDSRRDHARLVHNQAVTRPEKIGKIGEAMVAEALPGAVHEEKTRRVSYRRRLLGDGLGRQVVLELGEVHDLSVYRETRDGEADHASLPRVISATSVTRGPCPDSSTPGSAGPCSLARPCPWPPTDTCPRHGHSHARRSARCRRR
jgi:hypothetical protein